MPSHVCQTGVTDLVSGTEERGEMREEMQGPFSGVQILGGLLHCDGGFAGLMVTGTIGSVFSVTVRPHD